MVIVRIEREISNKLFVGGFETVKPTVRVCGDLAPGDDPAEAFAEIDKVAQELLLIAADEDVRRVTERRSSLSSKWSDDKTGELADSIERMK